MEVLRDLFKVDEDFSQLSSYILGYGKFSSSFDSELLQTKSYCGKSDNILCDL